MRSRKPARSGRKRTSVLLEGATGALIQVVLVAVILVLVLLGVVAFLPVNDSAHSAGSEVSTSEPALGAENGPPPDAGPPTSASSASTEFARTTTDGHSVQSGQPATTLTLPSKATEPPTPLPPTTTAEKLTEATHQSERGGPSATTTSDTAAFGGTLYVVIDDVGYNLTELKPFLDFPGNLTIAVLPKIIYSAKSAELAASAGKEVILHLPMEADDEQAMGPGGIQVDMPDATIADTIRAYLDSVPGAIGANNHMGSRATADIRVMDVVMSTLRYRDLFFLDSRTTADSVGEQAAVRYDVPFAARQVFLDDVDRSDDIESQLKEAEHIASRSGHAIIIGHVWSHYLAAILNSHYASLIREGFKFGRLSDIVHPVATGD